MRPPPILLPAAFAAFGVLWGTWQAVLPDLAAHYRLSSGPLGAILTAGFAVALPAMLGIGRFVDRWGAGRGMGLTAAAMGVALLLVAFLPPLPLLVVAVALMVVGSGAFDVAINGAAMADEKWSRPVRMTLLHAAYSGGGAAGALAAGGIAAGTDAFNLAYASLAVAMLAVAIVSARSGWVPARVDGAVPRAVALAMVPLAVLAGLAFLAEGSMETWSAIYLRDELGAVAFVGALGPAAFHAAMLAGRLLGATVVASLGPAATLLVAGSMTAMGMAVALAVPEPALAIPGMAVGALGAAFVVPVVVSLAARRAGAHAGRAASYVLTLGYAGFLVGPSLVGLLGELAGLRVALLVVPVAGALIGLAAVSRLARR